RREHLEIVGGGEPPHLSPHLLRGGNPRPAERRPVRVRRTCSRTPIVVEEPAGKQEPRPEAGLLAVMSGCGGGLVSPPARPAPKTPPSDHGSHSRRGRTGHFEAGCSPS